MPLLEIGRRGPRLGVAGTLAVAAVAILLAAGFGVLGGRPGPSAAPTLGGLGATALPAAPSEIIPTPAVTPFSECAPAPTSVPEVLLQVNGRPTPGSVQIVAWHIPAPAPRSHEGQQPPERVSVPVDVITELWIAGGACANAWNIGTRDGILDLFINDGLDPRVAAQNRFALALAPLGGQDLSLYADLYFPTLIAQVTWPIHVEAFERPVPMLQGAEPGAIVEGCDVALVLGNGYEYPRDPGCTGDLPYEPGDTPAMVVERGERLEFGLGDWDIQGAVLTCGRLSGTSFVAEPEPGCFLEASGRSEPGTFVMFPELPAELEPGTWTLAVSACALSGGLAATNNLCGTWYANVEIRD